MFLKIHQGCEPEQFERAEKRGRDNEGGQWGQGTSRGRSLANWGRFTKSFWYI